MLSLSLLLGILGAVAFVWFWQDSLGAREHANRAAMEACTRMNLQFLDGTVAFARLGLARNPGGQLRLRRTYIFDYTATSIERRQGFVVLLGLRIETVGFEPDRSVTDAAPIARPDIDANSSNVLDLAEWRQRHHKQLKPPAERSRSPGDNGW